MSSPASSLASGRATGRPVLLIAEDHEDSRTMLATLFTRQGFDVVECDDGETAVADAMRLRPDLVLLDEHLRRLDGISVLQVIRARQGSTHIPIVVTSGYSGAEHEQRARAAGCDHYMLKPFDLEALLRIVTRLTSHAPIATPSAT